MERLQERLQYRFKDIEFLVRAMTHRSYANEASEPTRDNQRLEFLGDAVLGMVITHTLFERYPMSSEGQLSKMKARLVCEQMLAQHARSLELGETLLLGRGEERTGGREKDSVLADAYEALIAAVHLDGGFAVAQSLILRQHAEVIDALDSRRSGDPKSKLQELLQDRFRIRPRYKIVNADGPDHARVFTAVVIANDETVGIGKGRSKKDAQQNAAKMALGRYEEQALER